MRFGRGIRARKPCSIFARSMWFTDLFGFEEETAEQVRRNLAHIATVLHDMNDAVRQRLKGKLRIGLQWDTEVTLADPAQIVSQAYCSALPIAYSHVDGSLWEPFARLILEATYEATLHAALINRERHGSNIVYLTLVGGGAFGNPQVWIMDALRQALQSFKDVPLDVRIVSYGSPSPSVKAMADGW